MFNVAVCNSYMYKLIYRQPAVLMGEEQKNCLWWKIGNEETGNEEGKRIVLPKIFAYKSVLDARRNFLVLL